MGRLGGLVLRAVILGLTILVCIYALQFIVGVAGPPETAAQYSILNTLDWFLANTSPGVRAIVAVVVALLIGTLLRR